jgi:hypothetical protein
MDSYFPTVLLFSMCNTFILSVIVGLGWPSSLFCSCVVVWLESHQWVCVGLSMLCMMVRPFCCMMVMYDLCAEPILLSWGALKGQCNLVASLFLWIW